jgi:hypothetical protein
MSQFTGDTGSGRVGPDPETDPSQSIKDALRQPPSTSIEGGLSVEISDDDESGAPSLDDVKAQTRRDLGLPPDASDADVNRALGGDLAMAEYRESREAVSTLAAQNFQEAIHRGADLQTVAAAARGLDLDELEPEDGYFATIGHLLDESHFVDLYERVQTGDFMSELEATTEFYLRAREKLAEAVELTEKIEVAQQAVANVDAATKQVGKATAEAFGAAWR